MVCVSRTTICQQLDFHIELFDPELISDTCIIILVFLDCAGCRRKYVAYTPFLMFTYKAAASFMCFLPIVSFLGTGNHSLFILAGPL